MTTFNNIQIGSSVTFSKLLEAANHSAANIEKAAGKLFTAAQNGDLNGVMKAQFEMQKQQTIFNVVQALMTQLFENLKKIADNIARLAR